MLVATLLVDACGGPPNLGAYRYFYVPSAATTDPSSQGRSWTVHRAVVDRLETAGLVSVDLPQMEVMTRGERDSLLVCSIEVLMERDDLGDRDFEYADPTFPPGTIKVTQWGRTKKTTVRIFLHDLQGDTVYKGHGNYVGRDADPRPAIDSALAKFAELFKASKKKEAVDDEVHP